MHNKTVCELCEVKTQLVLQYVPILNWNNKAYYICSNCYDDLIKQEQLLTIEAGKKLGDWFAKTKAVKRLYNRQGKLFSEEGGKGESTTSDPSPGNVGFSQRNTGRPKAL